MNKYLIIALLTGAALGVIIVDTMAGYSDTVSTRYSHQSISSDVSAVNNSLKKNDDESVIDSKVGNGSISLSMLMIGLTLVGLASFREGIEEYKKDRSKIANHKHRIKENN